MTNLLSAGTDCKADASDNVKAMFTRCPASISDIGIAVCTLDVEMEALEKHQAALGEAMYQLVTQQAALSVKYAVLRKALKRLELL